MLQSSLNASSGVNLNVPSQGNQSSSETSAVVSPNLGLMLGHHDAGEGERLVGVGPIKKELPTEPKFSISELLTTGEPGLAKPIPCYCTAAFESTSASAHQGKGVYLPSMPEDVFQKRQPEKASANSLGIEILFLPLLRQEILSNHSTQSAFDNPYPGTSFQVSVLPNCV